MQKKSSTTFDTRTVTLLGLLTALVVILQLLGGFIKFGLFSVTLVLLPIVVGAALCGTLAGVWLGFVFGFVVLVSGGANAFMQINAPATIVIVLLKGMLAGLASGAVYNLISKANFKSSRTVATVVAAIVSPIVNTGIYLIGCRLFFYDTIVAWADEAGKAIVVIIGLINFPFELIFNVVLSPTAVKVINIGEKHFTKIISSKKSSKKDYNQQ
ncbi:MAG: ECF transporter S component [Oscillospiraceae bacterium]|nr:ECF transporter S component [Oscillospiraceae bacterium]